MQKAFTLIELLVVVLIIGILSAVALPQYQKAVEKSRLSEAFTIVSSLSKAMDVWRLSHPASGEQETHAFTGTGADAYLDIDLSSLDCSSEDSCASKNFSYSAVCDDYEGGCYVNVYRMSGNDVLYRFYYGNENDSRTWGCGSCDYNGSLGQKICNDLVSQNFCERADEM